MENFSKYLFSRSGDVFNKSTGKQVSLLPNGKGYCLYNDQGKREIVSLERITVRKRRKLSHADVIRIYNDQDETKRVAATYGVLPSTVSKIRNNQTFTHITNPK